LKPQMRKRPSSSVSARLSKVSAPSTLAAVAGALTFAIFVADTLTNLEIAVAVFYSSCRSDWIISSKVSA
jgi:hypothetical protein